jgi:hypothetical protein
MPPRRRLAHRWAAAGDGNQFPEIPIERRRSHLRRKDLLTIPFDRFPAFRAGVRRSHILRAGLGWRLMRLALAASPFSFARFALPKDNETHGLVESQEHDN